MLRLCKSKLIQSKMIRSTTLGMPRIGTNCEIPKAVEDFIHKKIDQNQLQAVAQAVRDHNTELQIKAGIDIIPCNDFSFFDKVLDTTVLLGNIPRKYYWEGGAVSLEIYFTMVTGQQREKFDVAPMKIGRWFNTNYLFIVPEFSDPIEFVYSDNKHVLTYLETKKKFNIKARPVFFGPVSYLLMGTVAAEDVQDINKLHLVEEMMQVYAEVLTNCKRLGVTDIQIEEPMLTADLTREEQSVYRDFYTKMAEKAEGIKIHLVVPHGDTGNNIECIMSLPVESVHLDLVSGPNQLDKALELLSPKMSLSLGLVDAGNIWRNDIARSAQIAKKVADKIGSDRTIVGPSSSLFLCPLDASRETNVPAELQGLLSFAIQKVEEVAMITKIANGSKEFSKELKENAEAIKRIALMSQSFTKKAEGLSKKLSTEHNRSAPFAQRIEAQHKKIFGDNPPIMPVALNGKIPQAHNSEANEDSIKRIVELQEEIGIDVMSDCGLGRENEVEFVAKGMTGVFVPEHGFVQTYGTRCNRVPIIYDKPEATAPIYKNLAKAFRKATDKPIKINVNGPISFVNSCFFLPEVAREDIQILVAETIKRELSYIEAEGINVIGIDEQNMLRSVPIRNEHVADEVSKIINIFKYTCSNLKNTTQVHTSVLHSNFEEFLEDLSRLDSDVLMINSSRISGEIFESFISYRYPNHISLGAYDSWSERIPTPQEISATIKKCMRSLELDQIWISPDTEFCAESADRFLKTMRTIVNAVRDLRKK